MFFKFIFNKFAQLGLLLCLVLNVSACSLNWKSDDETTQDQLLSFYQQWKGTPYRLGGTGQAGIDCSALVMHSMRQVFGVKMPRTTEQQAEIGSRVWVARRKPGDLVFFKTGWRQRHVGIYVGDNRFLHASTSKGVIISSLTNSYWKKHYWKTIRI